MSNDRPTHRRPTLRELIKRLVRPRRSFIKSTGGPPDEPDFHMQMKAARRIARKRRNVLRELAKQLVRPRRSLIEEMGRPHGIADVEVDFPQSRDMPRAAKFDD